MKGPFQSLTSILVASSVLAFSGCERKSEGEKAIEKVGDAVGDAADKVGDAVEDATD